MKVAAPAIEVLAAARFRAAIPELAELLVDAVESGASVGFLPPFTAADAERWWRTLTDDVSSGRVLVLLLRVDGRTLGTAQLRLAQLPNARHRAEVAKVIVHSSARRRGHGRMLMDAVETLARNAGRHLLVLDTLSGSDAERLYAHLGWTRAAEIPHTRKSRTVASKRPSSTTRTWRRARGRRCRARKTTTAETPRLGRKWVVLIA